MLSRNIVFYSLIIFGLYCALTIGISYDEIYHHESGERRLKYLFSLGQFEYYNVLQLKYYSGLYDTLSYLIVSIFPRNYVYEAHHVVNFLVGISGLIALKKFVQILFNKKISDIFFLFSFFSPIYFGHLGINPKDTIICAAHFWTLYYCVKYLKVSELTDWTQFAIKIGFFIGFGIGVRVIFLGTLIPIIIFILLEASLIKKISKKIIIKNFLLDLFRIILISYFLLILCWPDVHKNIFIEPFLIIKESLSDLSLGVQLSYFANIFYETNNTPRYYLFLNFLYKLPFFYLILFFLSVFSYNKLLFFYKKKINYFTYKYLLSLFIFFFQVLIVIALKIKIHDGLRYLLYLVPLVNIPISIIVYYLYNNKDQFFSKFFSFITIPFFIYFLFNFINITPYHYSYLNILNKSFLNNNSFENDYWGTSIKELIIKFYKNENIIANPKIAVCGVNPMVADFYLKKYGFNYQKADIKDNFDYAILINRAIAENNFTSDKFETCYSMFKSKQEIVNVNKNSLTLSKIIVN